jgi:hypothetical protein
MKVVKEVKKNVNNVMKPYRLYRTNDRLLVRVSGQQGPVGQGEVAHGPRFHAAS